MNLTNGRWDDIDCMTKKQFLCMLNPSEHSKVPESNSDGVCSGRGAHSGHDEDAGGAGTGGIIKSRASIEHVK